MGWNCFQAEDKDDRTGPRTIGDTLRQKFPRLFSLIQRVKEKGAPSRIKKRFRRRHRIVPENSQISSCTTQKPSGVGNASETPKVAKPDGKAGFPRRYTAHHTDDKGQPEQSTPRAIVTASVGEDIEDDCLIKRTASPDEEELESMACDIVNSVLRNVTEPEKCSPDSPGLSPDESEDKAKESLDDCLEEKSLPIPTPYSPQAKNHQMPTIPWIIFVNEYKGDQSETLEDSKLKRKAGLHAGSEKETVWAEKVAGGEHAKGDSLTPRRSTGYLEGTDDDRSGHITRGAIDGRDRPEGGAYGGFGFPKGGAYDAPDLPVRRILGQDDLLALGLEISRKNTDISTRHSFHSV